MTIGDLKNNNTTLLLKRTAKIDEEDKKEMTGMTFKPVKNKRSESTGERSTVNIAEEMPEPVLGEFPGVVVKESLVKDILGEGGPFEKYKQEKMKEALQFIEDQKAEAEMEGKIIVEGGVDLKPIIPIDDIEQHKLDMDDEESTQYTVKAKNNITSFQSGEGEIKLKIQEDDIFD